jgi:hypothetical protein
MLTLSPVKLAEIAQELDSGMCCYLNIQSGEFIFIPDTSHWGDMDMDIWKEDLKKIKKDKKYFHCIEPPSSKVSFEMMADFVETLDPSQLITKLLGKALERKHPFRGFKDIIDESGKLSEEWFAFKNAKLHEWVKKEIAYLGLTQNVSKQTDWRR